MQGIALHRTKFKFPIRHHLKPNLQTATPAKFRVPQTKQRDIFRKHIGQPRCPSHFSWVSYWTSPNQRQTGGERKLLFKHDSGPGIGVHPGGRLEIKRQKIPEAEYPARLLRCALLSNISMPPSMLKNRLNDRS